MGCLLVALAALILPPHGFANPEPAGTTDSLAQRSVHPQLAGYPHLPATVRSTPRERNTPKFGPPPPGYIRIIGGAVPGWQPADLLVPAPRGAAWSFLGPRPITNEYWSGNDLASGRVVSVAPHPTDPKTVYIASASGGIWKTVDAGLTWVPLTDELAVLNHGAVALDPLNPETIYAGTGEYTTASTGDGLFRSLDGGLSWVRLATADQVGSTCSRIVVDPTDPSRIHLTGSEGYYRSTDRGLSWVQGLADPASDVAINPLDPQIVYVGIHGVGVFRSTDGGETFSKLHTDLPIFEVRRVLLAVAPSNPKVVYAAMINSSAGLRGFYRSADGGDSWEQKTATPDFPNPQGWYDACIAVDPAEEDVVYAGGVFPSYAVAGVIKTTDGGDSWEDVTVGKLGGQLHPDQHAIAFGPDGTIWVGNDGGVWKTANGGQSWINTNATLCVTQNYQIALHPSDPAQLLGGTQDNGTIGRPLDDLAWPQVLGGDGGFAAYDHSWPLRRYTTYVYLTVYRDSDGVWDLISGPWSSDPRNFIAPLVMDPHDARVLLGGTNRVWRTLDADGAAQWAPISDSKVGGGGPLNAIAIAPGDSQVIYTGSSTGKVFVTTDAAVWNDRSAGLPEGAISDVCVSPADAGSAFVSFYNTSGPRVLRTGDYGLSWIDATGTLPAGVSVTALEVDWRFKTLHLYAGSGAGVYETHDGGATWLKDGADLPNVNIGDLRIDPIERTITVGTYGRGAWRKLLPANAGDLNCDGQINALDIDPFVLALTDPQGYAVAWPDCAEFLADVNLDGRADAFDIDAFIALLTGP